MWEEVREKVTLDSKIREKQSPQGGGDQGRAHQVKEGGRRGQEERLTLAFYTKHKLWGRQTRAGHELTCGFVKSYGCSQSEPRKFKFRADRSVGDY